MRQIIYASSAKAIYLDRELLIIRLKSVAQEAGSIYPEIKKIILFGSLSKGEETGLSDIDLFLLVDSKEKNPIERTRPYFFFFSGKFDIGIDVLTATDREFDEFKEMLKGAVVLYER